MTARPWRAAAYVPGPPRYWFGHTSAKTRAGLSRSVDRWRSLGLTVEVWQVQPIPEVAQLTQVAAGPPGYVGAP